MRKLRSLIAAILVVLIQITPGPLGLRPAQAVVSVAVLAPVAVGALILAAGVAGTDTPAVFANAVYSAANTVVDAASQQVHYTAIAAKAIGVSGSETIYGISQQLSMSFGSLADWVSSHSSDYPNLSPVVSGAFAYNPPRVGDVVQPSGSPSRIKVGNYRWLIAASVSRPYSSGYGTGSHYLLTEYGANYSIDYLGSDPSSTTSGIYNIYQWSGTVTTDPETNRNAGLNPTALAGAYPKTSAVDAEQRKLFKDMPPAMWNPAQGTQIKPFSPAQVAPPIAKEGVKEAEKNLEKARDILTGNPDSVTAQTGVREAENELAQKELELQETEAESNEELDDIPYSPDSLGDPYTLPEVDFGQRLQQFIDVAKSSSIFSLPGTVFGNIPGSGSSVMTINGGQIFGVHNFDFADMAGMWAILRGIVLTGFSFIAVRIVTLKR